MESDFIGYPQSRKIVITAKVTYIFIHLFCHFYIPINTWKLCRVGCMPKGVSGVATDPTISELSKRTKYDNDTMMLGEIKRRERREHADLYEKT